MQLVLAALHLIPNAEASGGGAPDSAGTGSHIKSRHTHVEAKAFLMLSPNVSPLLTI